MIMDATPSFLSRNDEDQQDDREELPPPRVHQTPFPMYPMMPPQLQTTKTDLFGSIQWHMILLGVILGFVLSSMRPIVIKSIP